MSVLLSEGFFCMTDSIRRRFPAEARPFPLFSEKVSRRFCMWVRRLFFREGVSGVKMRESENMVCFRISLQVEPSKPAQA